MKRLLTYGMAMLLTGCIGVQPPGTMISYSGAALAPTANAQGWYTFGSMSYKGPLRDGAPDGEGLCADNTSMRREAQPCTFAKGNRTDTAYIQARREEIETARRIALDEQREQEASAARYRAQQRAERAEGEREMHRAIVGGLASLQQSGRELQETDRRIAQATAQAEREQRDRAEERQATARRERERLAAERAEERERAANAQRLAQAKQSEQAARQAAARQTAQTPQDQGRHSTPSAQKDAANTRAAAPPAKPKKEPKAETCVLEGTGICRGGAVTKTSGGTFYVRQPNNCGYRLYARICITTKSGKDACGADSIQPGGSTSYWHSSDDVTGQYTVTTVGVLKGGDDWSCMGEKRRLGSAD